MEQCLLTMEMVKEFKNMIGIMMPFLFMSMGKRLHEKYLLVVCGRCIWERECMGGVVHETLMSMGEVYQWGRSVNN